MKQKQYILHSLTIEVIAVLLASMIAFQICNMLSIRMSLLPFVMAVGYVILKLLYHLCISIARYIIETPLSHLALADEVTDKKTSAVASLHTQDCVEVQKRRMELFHYEYQHEQQQYKQQKEREEDEKLNAGTMRKLWKTATKTGSMPCFPIIFPLRSSPSTTTATTDNVLQFSTVYGESAVEKM